MPLPPRRDREHAAAPAAFPADLEVGLVDASMVVLAERHRTADVLTFDHRHFRAVTWGEGRPCRLLPADG